VAEIVNDVKTINKLYNTNEPTIYFETPMFMFDTEEIDALVDIRQREELKFTWRTETRVEYLDKQPFDKLAMAGLRVVDLGLESASPQILLRMNKTSTPDSYLKAATGVLKKAFENGIIIKLNLLFYIGETRNTLSETITFLDSNRDYIQSISAYPFILYPGVRDNLDIQTQLSQHGGSFDISGKWEERHLIAINPSAQFSYAELQHIGTLFGQSYQSINTFFDQKRFGYLSPGISFSEFKTQAEHIGVENFPFFADKRTSETAKSELMRIISRGA
jgi:anaerobic magnesium-protoporphyrin IX monomethyl ester cyclase